MRCGSRVISLLVALSAIAGGAEGAYAQSFLEKLFGTAAANRDAYRPGASLRDLRRYAPVTSESDETYEPDTSERGLSSAGTYRTMCVRMCDGYYWPVSSSARRGNFRRDARICQSSCDMEARLFYLPRLSDDIARMTDLTGRAYGRLPTAFAYRKSMPGGCVCKPEPWSETAAARHLAYARARPRESQEIASVAPLETAAVPEGGNATAAVEENNSAAAEPHGKAEGVQPAPPPVSQTSAAETDVSEMPPSRSATPRSPAPVKVALRRKVWSYASRNVRPQPRGIFAQ